MTESSGLGSLAGLPLFEASPPASPIQLRFGTAAPAVPSTAPASQLTTARRAIQDPTHNPAPDDLDWALIREMRGKAADTLAGAQLTAANAGLAFDERQAGADIVTELLQEHATDMLHTGVGQAMSIQEQAATVQAVIDALFGMGRISPLLRQKEVENIEAIGHDAVLLEDSTGELRPGPKIAASDAELIADLQFLASRHGRPFSEAVPWLDLELAEDGSRLAAMAWVTPRPTVQIRRHRLHNIDLDTLVGLNTISPLMASFLTAAVRSGRSIVVAGAQGAGKTTLVRALCAAFGSWEKIGTFETERELGLDKLDKHARVIAWEARPGSGEISADGRRAGEVTLRDLLKSSFRYNLDRYVVGEVRGDEILEMIEAMISGQGTISTTHARNARDILSKLVTCALKAGPNISETYATKAIAQHVDLMIYIKRDQTPLAPGEESFAHRARFVTEVVSAGWSQDGPNYTDIFVPGPDGHAKPNILPEHLRDLADHGFDLASFQRESGQQ
jgi:Flp pilus assembly CpaF family ATPase